MNAPRITLLASLDSKMRLFLQGHPQGHERAAAILFRRLCRDAPGLEGSDRFIAVEVIPFEEEWITASSPHSVAFHTSPLRNIFQRCEEEGLVFGFAHNHPSGHSAFSSVDDQNELTLLQALVNRNGVEISFVALLLCDGAWSARIRYGRSPVDALPVRHTAVVGTGISIFGFEPLQPEEDGFESRQAAAFGGAFVSALRSLRVGVVGAGGTGSPTATLLARAGVGELIIIDNDKLSKSNLNRVRGAAVHQIGKNKAEVLGKFINSLGLPTRVSVLPALVDSDPAAVDALASCDIVFGCTDDQIGRDVLNVAVYSYALALIDVGLGGKVVLDHKGNALLRYHHGRVSVVLPESGECLYCQGVLTQGQIARQQALRDNPDLSDEEARQSYIEGAAEHAPGVGPFTSAAADFGVSSMFNLLRPFRRLPADLRPDLINIDFVSLRFSSPAERDDADCSYCRMHLFLLREKGHRLSRPVLGKAQVHV